MSCAATLQEYDAERDAARYKFDMQRDEAQRKFIADILGVKLRDNPARSGDKTTSSHEQNQKMTRQDIMQRFSK